MLALFPVQERRFGVRQRVGLDDRMHALQHREVQRVLAVSRDAAVPPRDVQPGKREVVTGYRDRVEALGDDQLAVRPQAANQAGLQVAVGHGVEDDPPRRPSPAAPRWRQQAWSCRCTRWLPKLAGEFLTGRTAARWRRRGSPSFVAELDGEVADPADAVNRDEIAGRGRYVECAQPTVERGGDAAAHHRGDLLEGQAFRVRGRRPRPAAPPCTRRNFAVEIGAGDGAVDAVGEIARADEELTGKVAATGPAHADPVSQACHIVTPSADRASTTPPISGRPGTTRQLRAEQARARNLVAAADPARVHLDAHLPEATAPAPGALHSQTGQPSTPGPAPRALSLESPFLP